MSERLTDEQLRDLQENAEMHDMVHSPAVHSAVAELLDLREMVNAEIVGTERPELIALRAALRKSEKSDNLRTLPDPHGVLGIKEKMRQSLEDEDVLCISPSDLTKLLNDHDALTECVAYLTDAWPAARALLSEAEVWLAKGVFKHHTDDLLARIAAELEPKP